MLSIARWILLRHQKLSTFKALEELLDFAAKYFLDLGVFFQLGLN